jgi:hypothetical protein
MPVIPAVESLRQENHKFKTSLGYIKTCVKMNSCHNSLTKFLMTSKWFRALNIPFCFWFLLMVQLDDVV